MQQGWKTFLLITVLYSFTNLHAQQDSVMYQRDSVIDMEDNCTVGFFERSTKLTSLSKTQLLLKTGKTVTVTNFLRSNHMNEFADHGLNDLDNDGKKELVIINFTGGAHCCDEVYIFRPIAANKYQYVAKLFAGDVCIGSDNLFIYHFYQQLGYFFTCFACGYSDTSDAAPLPLSSVTIRYSKGKLAVVPGDKELRSTINDNLAKLGEQPYVKMDNSFSQDDGLRKEFALNLAVFYYSFGKNLIETQKLFQKYYKYPDAKKVWAEFVKHLQSIKKQSDL